MSFPFTVPLPPEEVVTPTVNQRCPLGTRGMTADGRVYRYAKNGTTALNRGYLVQSEAAATQWENTTFANWVTGWLTQLGTTYIPAGTTYAYLSATGDSAMTIAKDYFKEGYFFVSGTSTAGGQYMKIKEHPAASSGSSGVSPNNTTGGRFKVVFEAGYSFTDNIDTGVEISMMKNAYKDVIVAATAPTGGVLGVPNCYVPASYYFWCQTWGACAVKNDDQASIVTNKYFVNSSSVAGTIECATNATGWFSGAVYEQNQIAVGFGLQSTAVAANEASTFPLIHLTIAP